MKFVLIPLLILLRFLTSTAGAAAPLLLAVSLNASALTDPQELEFIGAVNSGDMKTVKMYVETMNVDLEQGYFAWTPFLMAAAKRQCSRTLPT